MYWSGPEYGWRVLLSTGSGWDEKSFGKGSQLGYWWDYNKTSNQSFHFTGDFNGDGKTDFMYWSGPECGWRVLLSTGSGWDDKFFGKGSQLGYWWDYHKTSNQSFHFTGDYNGDGKTDYMYWSGPECSWRVLNTTGFNPDLILSILTPLRGSIAVSYIPISQISGAIRPSDKVYPNIANYNSSLLVNKITYNNNLGHYIDYSYNYSNGVLHLGLPHERANLGFEWIEKTDENTGSSVKTYYHHDDIDLRWLIKKEETYGSDRKLYLVKEYRYAKELIKDNNSSPEWHDVKFIYKTDDYLYNYNGEDSTPVEYRVEYRYDTYTGDLVETINHGDTAVASDDQRTVIEYVPNSTDHVTLPAVVRKYAIGLDGSEGLASETRFFYTNYLLTKKEFENGSSDVTQSYAYDDYGNLIAETDGNGNTGTITYDNDYHTFVRKVTNALGHTKETVYDHLMRPVKTIDANGAVWETVYDEFSREKATIAPGDDAANPTTRKTYPDEFIDDQTGEPLFPRRMKTELKDSGTDYLVKYEYLDGLGRVIQQKTEADDGWITIDRYYDNSGREYRVSVPYLTATFEYTAPDETIKYSLIEFDPIGREKAVHNTDGTVTRKVYGKLETLTIDPKGHVTGKRINGNTEYQTSYTDVYPYHAEYAVTTTEKAWDGIRITDAVGNVLETRLDMLGRKVSYHDPDMGLWTYVYDANSNLISQTDAKGQTIVMEYDAVNRLVKKEYPDGSMVRFYYDEDGHGSAKGRLTRVVYPEGAEDYNYDARGRQTSITQTIGRHSRTQSMTYDSMDRVVTTTYPDGEVVQSVYNRSGNLKTLSGDLTYVNGIDYTAYGKISKIQYGNGVQTVYDYYDEASEYDNSADTYHSYRLKQIRVSKNGGDIFNLGYEYDRAGNVKVKRDFNVSNFTEEYSYDDLNRLIGSGSPAYGYSLYRYDEINNIIEKDLRTYQYSGSQPHAVTSDGRYTYTYDANGNMIGRSDGRVISWDYENRVKSISDGGSFAYDPSGRRIKKTENGITTYYFFATYEEEYQDGIKNKSVKFYFAGDQRVAEYSSIDGLRYYHQDHLGSSIALTDITGALVFRANYAPYGSDAFTQGSTSIKYKFTGQEKDGSGLYYYGARYYDPELGRFISPDVNLDGLNRYTYCHNNPVIYNDPTGEWAWIIGTVIGAWTGHEVAESKGIDFGSLDWWKHVITGAVIGGVAGWAGEAATKWAATQGMSGIGSKITSNAALASSINVGIGGATSCFIYGFGNSWVFGGQETELFQGDLGDSFVIGLTSAVYGFAISGLLNYGLETFKSNYDLRTSFKFVIEDKAGNQLRIDFRIINELLKKYGLDEWVNDKINSFNNWVNRNINDIVQSMKEPLIYSSYSSCAIVNLIVMVDPQFKFKFGSYRIPVNPIIWDERTRETRSNNDPLSITFKTKF